jgi:hypothetical protein
VDIIHFVIPLLIYACESIYFNHFKKAKIDERHHAKRDLFNPLKVSHLYDGGFFRLKVLLYGMPNKKTFKKPHEKETVS